MKKNHLHPGLTRVTLALMEALNSPMSAIVTQAVQDGDWTRLASLRVDPSQYGREDVDLFRRDYQAVEFLRKSPLLPLPATGRRQRAIEAFEDCEIACAVTNRFIEELMFSEIYVPHRAEFSAFRDILSRARKIARRILGRIPDDITCRFGPGTTFELKGSKYCTVLDKMYTTPTATPLAMDLFNWSLHRTLWGKVRAVEMMALPGIARGNRFTTVPKDATKDRGICIEPVGNLWLQLGVGGYLKGRLAQVGLEVGVSPFASDPPHVWRASTYIDGQKVHGELARLGSITGDWSTIDLSNASDTVALELVRAVLPPDWFDLLYSLRSPYTLMPNGKWVRLEKFSSMGNGFTFELETLIFACLISAATGLQVGSEFKVYGDDIIVPAPHFASAMSILRFAGFQPNDRKTFTEGPFRESCGSDFFAGVNVRPSYADSDLATPLDWYVMHNQLKARWPMATRALKACIDEIPTRLRHFGPTWLGDMVLHGPYEPKLGNDGILTCKALVAQTPSVDLERWSPELHLAAILTGAVEGDRKLYHADGRLRRVLRRSELSVRGEPTGFRTISMSIS